MSSLEGARIPVTPARPDGSLRPDVLHPLSRVRAPLLPAGASRETTMSGPVGGCRRRCAWPATRRLLPALLVALLPPGRGPARGRRARTAARGAVRRLRGRGCSEVPRARSRLLRRLPSTYESDVRRQSGERDDEESGHCPSAATVEVVERPKPVVEVADRFELALAGDVPRVDEQVAGRHHGSRCPPWVSLTHTIRIGPAGFTVRNKQPRGRGHGRTPGPSVYFQLGSVVHGCDPRDSPLRRSGRFGTSAATIRSMGHGGAAVQSRSSAGHCSDV